MQDFAHSPWAEIAWYFPETREQLRLLGLLTVVTCTSARADEQQVRVEAPRAWRAGWRGPVVRQNTIPG